MLELTRPANLALGVLTVPLGATMVLGADWTSAEAIVVGLHALSVASFMAAGNVMNDLKDVDVDRVAHPNRALPSGRVSPTAARRWAGCLWFASVLFLAASLPMLASWGQSVLIWTLAAQLMVAYDHGPNLKSKGHVPFGGRGGCVWRGCCGCMGQPGGLVGGLGGGAGERGP